MIRETLKNRKMLGLLLASICVASLSLFLAHAGAYRPSPQTSSGVRVLVRKETVSWGVIYKYEVINNSGRRISAIQIGYNKATDTPQLTSMPLDWDFDNGIPPGSQSSPNGWQVELITTEESPYSFLEWRTQSETGGITHQQSLAGFSVVLLTADDTYQNSFWTAHLGDGTSVSAPLELAP